MTNQNGTGGVDLSGPLAGMWRDVYRKAGAVAEARTQELLKYHVYTYPHGAGGGGGGGGAWSLVEKVTVASPTDRVAFAAVPVAGDCLLLISRGSVTGATGENGAYYGLLFNADTFPGTTDKYDWVHAAVYGEPGAVAQNLSTGSDRFAYLGYFGASLSGTTANDGGGVSISYLPDFRAAARLNALSEYQVYHSTLYAYGTARVVGGRYSTVYAEHGPLTALAVQCGNGLQFDAGSTFALYALSPGGGGDGGGGGDTIITTDASLSVTESPADTFALAARLSADSGNALSLHADGLYATDTGGGGGTGNTTMYTQTTAPTGATNSLWFNPSESA